MASDVYKQSLEIMNKRGGVAIALDLPEYYAMMEALFTPEECEVNNAMPEQVSFTADEIAKQMGRDAQEVEALLQQMAKKGLCLVKTEKRNGANQYEALMLVPGLMEFVLFKGTTTDWDKKVAKAMRAYKEVMIKTVKEMDPDFNLLGDTPWARVIPVDSPVATRDKVHTYNHVKSFVDRNEMICTSMCYCRNEAFLCGEDLHGMPLDVCMQFGEQAEYAINYLGARRVTKEEAHEVLKRTNEAGLVYMGLNMQALDGRDTFICSCDRWHCGSMQLALLEPKPGKALNSGMEPRFDTDLCTACGVCLDRCPPEALAMGDDDVPEVDLDRCFGCAVCATGCPVEAIAMANKPDFKAPPKDEAELYKITGMLPPA